MPSTKPQLKTIVCEEEYQKFKTIAIKENRTISNLLQTLVREKIDKYESQNGTIKVTNINNNQGTIRNINL